MKRMDNKYFVPDIEDLRVGYKCEVNALATADRKEDKWVFTCIQRIDHIERAEIALTLKYLRTPYLTKEQIEAEGWTCIGQNPYINNNFYYFKKDGRFLDFNGVTHEIKIAEDSEYPDYNGECKSVNEFRFICKLLKI